MIGKAKNKKLNLCAISEICVLRVIIEVINTFFCLNILL